MASFDMITAVGKAYQTTWRERHYLFRMALIPLLIKYVCSIISLLYVENENILRLSLVMIPAYFAEGWFLTHWARTIVLGHRWPFQPSGNDVKDLAQLKERGRGILSATVAFVLIHVLMGGYFAFFVSFIPMDIDPKDADPSVAIAGMIMMTTSLLGFRFVWLYIPMALNISIPAYIKKLKRLSLTFSMLGVWLVCFVPVVLLLQIIGGVLHGMMGDGVETSILTGISIFIREALDMVKNLLVTAGMAYAFIEIFKWAQKEGK